MDSIKKEQLENEKVNSSVQLKKTSYIVTFGIVPIENDLYEQYARKRELLTEEEIKKRNEDKKKKILEVERGTVFSCEIIELKDGRQAFIFYNRGPHRGIWDIYRIAEGLKVEYFIYARLQDDDSFNFSFLKEFHREGTYFRHLDRMKENPKIKPLPLDYKEVDRLSNVKSLFCLNKDENYSKFKQFGFDIDFSSFIKSIERFELEIEKLYPTVKTCSEDKHSLHSAIKRTFCSGVGVMGFTAMKTKKNMSIISSGELFEKGLFPSNEYKRESLNTPN